jgi:hypothetical protein
MSRLGGVRNNGAGGGNVGGRGGVGQRAVNVRDLGEEEQRAHELLEALQDLDPGARTAVLARAGAGDPVTAQGLKRVAAMYAKLGMSLDARGLARFKADRALPQGAAISNALVARAYARAIEGKEIIVRLERGEEQQLRPSERALVDFLRDMQRKRDADDLRPVKEVLGLKNPSLPPPVAALKNEYVGLHGVREIAKLTTLRNIALTPESWRRFLQTLEKEKA